MKKEIQQSVGINITMPADILLDILALIQLCIAVLA